MNKQQQDQKRIELAQKQAAKNQVEQRNQVLLQKEFYAREWKAEIDLMNYEMEYFEVLDKYKSFKDKQKLIKEEDSNPQIKVEVDDTATIENFKEELENADTQEQ